MLTQYQLLLFPERPCQPRPEWAYRFYAAMLYEASREFGDLAHQDAVTPVSQFLRDTPRGLQWTVNLLGDESERALSPVLERMTRVRLKREGLVLKAEKQSCRVIRDTEELFALSAKSVGVHRLCFHTATCFKSRGQYLPLPTMRLIVQSLIKKWNGCIPECPIEDQDGQGMEALAEGLRPRDFHLHSRNYFLKGHSLPGFVGDLTLENRLGGFHRELTEALLSFADFAGVGIKTTLGMGGVEHIPLL